MYLSVLSTAAAVVSLPLLAAASPVATPKGISIPISKRVTKSSPVADIAALRAQLARLEGKYARTLDNFKKNTGAEHPLAALFNNTSGVAKKVTGSDALIDFSDELWYGSIDIGTPAVTYTVDVDTGSSDLFVPSSSCSSCGSHTPYHPRASSTSRDVGITFSLSFGDGSTVSGELYTDTVSISGLTATGQTLGSATSYSSSFQTGPDGLIGLSFPSLSSYPATPYFNNLIHQGVVTVGQFGLKLASRGSSLFLGGVDTSLYRGAINWNRVTDVQQGYWQISLDAVSVGSKRPVTGTTSVIDSGTTLIVGDVFGVADFYAAIPGSAAFSSGFYTFPCSLALPLISLTFGRHSYAVQPAAFNLGPAFEGSSDCLGAVVSANFGFWIVGDVFMRGVYTAFDFDNSRIGFAKLA